MQKQWKIISHFKGKWENPLKYVMRRNTMPVLNATYQKEQEEIIAIALLVGDDFLRNNNHVYGII